MSRTKSKAMYVRVLMAIGVAVTIGALSPEASALPHDGFTDPGLPPVHPNPEISYYGRADQVMYETPLAPLVLTDIRHFDFTNVYRTPLNEDEVEVFDSRLSATATGGGLTGPTTVELTGPTQTIVRGYQHDQAGTFDTEILSMSLKGNIGGIPVEIRESPSLPSTGKTTIVDLGGGLWNIDSFFDVFTEISIDGGQFQPPIITAGPGSVHMELCPEPATMALLALGGVALLKRRKR